MKLRDLTPKKLISFFLLTTLVPLIAVGSALLALTYRDLTAQSRQDAQSILDQAQTEVTHQVSLWKNIARLAAAQESSAASLRRFLTEFNDMQSIRYVDTANQLRAVQKRFGVIRMSELDLPAIQTRRVLQGPVQWVDEGEPRVPIAAVVVSPARRDAGFLAIDFDVSVLQEKLRAFHQDLLLREGDREFITVIARESAAADDEAIITRRFIPDLGWTLELRQSWAAVYRPVVRLLLQIVAAVFIIGFLAIAIGWSMSKRVEANIAHRERLSTIGEMAGVISHEMKTALAVIKNSLEFLKDHLPGTDPKTGRHLEIIDSQVKASNQILSDILSFSKAPALASSSCDINKLLAEVIDVTPVPGHVELSRKFSDRGPHALAEPGQIKQVAANLIQNAVQAMENDGSVSVETGEDGQHVFIRIIDTGCGIPFTAQKRIFEPFFTTKSQGTGLGLSIVKRLVEQNNGQIEVASVPNTGTTITVKFKQMPTPPAREEIT